MVKVRADQPFLEDGSVDLDAWLAQLVQATPTKCQPEKIQLACRLVKEAELQTYQLEQSTNCLEIGLKMAQILVELKLDQESLVAAILYRAVREKKLTMDTVHQHFGATVAKLISSVQGMAAISQTSHADTLYALPNAHQTENIRKMLVSIIDDVRVALIKLAERTCAIRAVKQQSREKKEQVAREVFDIYAPLAHRLGIGYLKWELEDLSFRYLRSTEYKKIARLLDERRLDRQHFIDKVINELQKALGNHGISADVYGRPKHIYSIWRKMRQKNADFRELYDIRAFRVLVKSVPNCYATLGIVHTLWKHIPKEFDDYIATPKENGYRSLHTAVIGPEGKTMEVQIRTHEMHDEAELGVCAHWKYKGTDASDNRDSYEEKLSWLRQVLEWHEELGDLDRLAEQWRSDVESDRIYVFTKAGHVVNLPSGATPVDFAYHIHTDVGNTCRGAKVGGRIVPLNHKLRTGDQVHILTNKSSTPSRDWLNPHLNYLATAKARAKVTQWFKNQDRDLNLVTGRAMVEAEFKRLDIHFDQYEKLSHAFNYKNVEDLYTAVGASDLRVTQVVSATQRLQEPKPNPAITSLPSQGERTSDKLEPDIQILGVGNLMTQIARCCQPVPGDVIVGYITIGRGVTIHRVDCPNALQHHKTDACRIIKVNWGHAETNRYPVNITIEAIDRAGLLKDITCLLANEQIDLMSLQTQVQKKGHRALAQACIKIPNLSVLGRVLDRLMQLPNVIKASRKR